jgi:hypothetical protein
MSSDEKSIRLAISKKESDFFSKFYENTHIRVVFLFMYNPIR